MFGYLFQCSKRLDSVYTRAEKGNSGETNKNSLCSFTLRSLLQISSRRQTNVFCGMFNPTPFTTDESSHSCRIQSQTQQRERQKVLARTVFYWLAKWASGYKLWDRETIQAAWYDQNLLCRLLFSRQETHYRIRWYSTLTNNWVWLRPRQIYHWYLRGVNTSDIASGV